jgi:hypothetical protein
MLAGISAGQRYYANPGLPFILYQGQRWLGNLPPAFVRLTGRFDWMILRVRCEALLHLIEGVQYTRETRRPDATTRRTRRKPGTDFRDIHSSSLSRWPEPVREKWQGYLWIITSLADMRTELMALSQSCK